MIAARVEIKRILRKDGNDQANNVIADFRIDNVVNGIRK